MSFVSLAIKIVTRGIIWMESSSRPSHFHSGLSAFSNVLVVFAIYLGFLSRVSSRVSSYESNCGEYTDSIFQQLCGAWISWLPFCHGVWLLKIWFAAAAAFVSCRCFHPAVMPCYISVGN
eukprot:c28534_g2_i1 orf=61-420(+)